VSQRDAAEVEKRQTAQRELEQREVRFRVMEEFLKLRGRNESNFARWVAILEDSFNLTIPVTDFRKMVESKTSLAIPETPSMIDAPKVEQSLNGPSEAMADANHLASFLQTLGSASGSIPKRPVTLAYQCDRKNFFMDGCTGFLSWTATSLGAVGQGAPLELTVNGNMRAKFNPASNKLISAEVMFDTGSVASQLQMLDSPKSDLDDCDDACDAVAAAAQAAAAASEADALLDSIQMPQLGISVPSAVTILPSPVPRASEEQTSAVSVTSSEKDDSSDESLGDGTGVKNIASPPTTDSGVVTRRSTRRKE